MNNLVVDSVVSNLDNINVQWVDGPKCPDGKPSKMRIAVVKTKVEAKGSFIVCPGRAEYIEKYASVITELNNRGFDVLIVDQRGQGMSSRFGKDYELGDIDNFDNASKHIAGAFEFVKQDLRPPYYILSHSMGGAITLNALIKDYLKDIKAAIFVSPMWGLGHIFMMRNIINTLCLLGQAKKVAPGLNPKWVASEFKNNDLTHDTKNFARNNALMLKDARLRIGGPTNHWIKESFGMIDNFTENNIKKINFPILIINADMETVVDKKAQAKIASYFSNVAFSTLSDAKHEILMETPKVLSCFWTKFDEFMKKEGAA